MGLLGRRHSVPDLDSTSCELKLFSDCLPSVREEPGVLTMEPLEVLLESSDVHSTVMRDDLAVEKGTQLSVMLVYQRPRHIYSLRCPKV